MTAGESREQTLRAHGAHGEELQELLRYTESRFQTEQLPPLPLADEQCVTTWREYAEIAATTGVFACLRERLVQLRFAIAEGMSEDTSYRAATRRGQLAAEVLAQPGLVLSSPESLELVLHPTPAGTVPILQVGDRSDFVKLVQALVHRNEPHPIPDAVGAMIIGGYNNWDRIHAYRRAWEEEAANRRGDDLGWSMELQRLIPQRHLYKDSFILLTRGPYSGIAAPVLGLPEPDWIEMSLAIRRAHECTHYFTRRVLGSMSNLLYDELLADLAGIVAAVGRFHASWFLRFMGLESFPQVRDDGRVHQYRGQPPLSEGAFKALQSMLCAAASNLEAADLTTGAAQWTLDDQAAVLCGLARLTLVELAADDAVDRLRRHCRPGLSSSRE